MRREGLEEFRLRWFGSARVRRIISVFLFAFLFSSFFKDGHDDDPARQPGVS
jgi:hypothetical protein